MKKTSANLAAILTVGIALISQGLDMLKNNPTYGVILIIIGFGTLAIGAFLYSKKILSLVSSVDGGAKNDRSVP